MKQASQESVAKWTPVDWSAALIGPIFYSTVPNRKISRIPSSSRLLGAVANLEPEEAEKLFISSFGSTRAKILRAYKFNNSTASNATKQAGFPVYFSALYLSLLAASADEDTYWQGDFRSRFKILINRSLGFELFQESSLSNSFADLPLMWNQLKFWLKGKNESDHYWAALVLPDRTDRETHIGYSKRLAFPSFKDEKLFRDVLRQMELNRNSSPYEIVRAIDYNRHYQGFSTSFLEEFLTFRELILAGNEMAAVDTPFWGAVRDISYEHEEFERKKIGRYCILVDISEPLSFKLNIFTDATGALSNPGITQAINSRYLDTFDHRFIDSFLWKEGRHWTKNAAGFSKSVLGRSINAGFLTLYVDEFGDINSEGNFYSGGDIHFLVSQEKLELLRRSLRNQIVDNRFESRIYSGWTLLTVRSVTQQERVRIFSALPDEFRVGANYSETTEKIRLVGAIRIPNSNLFLLNVASDEKFILPEGATATYQFIDESDETIAKGNLKVISSGYLQIDSTEKQIAFDRATVRIETQRETDRNLLREIRVTKRLPYIEQIKLPPDDTFTEGSCGSILRYSELFDTSNSENGLVLSRDDWLDDVCPVFRGTTPYEPDINQKNLDFAEVYECLYTRFLSTASISFAEFTSILKNFANAFGERFDAISRQIFLSGILRRVYPGGKRYGMLTAEKRFISEHYQNGKFFYAISGLFCFEEIRRIFDTLEKRQIDFESDGVIQYWRGRPIRFSSQVKLNLNDLSLDFNLEPWVPTHQIDPFRGFRLSESELRKHRDLPKHCECWNVQKKRWEDDINAPFNARASIYRVRNNDDEVFYIKHLNQIYSTRSRIWAFLTFHLRNEGHLFTMTPAGGLHWVPVVREIPAVYSLWWIHEIGGVISLDRNERIAMIDALSGIHLSDQIFSSNCAWSSSNQLMRWRKKMVSNRRAIRNSEYKTA